MGAGPGPDSQPQPGPQTDRQRGGERPRPAGKTAGGRCMGPAQRLAHHPAALGEAVGTWLDVSRLFVGVEARAGDGGRLAVAALLGAEGQRRRGGAQQPLGKAAAR
jgi:hypothetical protein